MGERVRYDILVQTSSRGVRKQDFVFNRDPLRPGSVPEELNEIVEKQFEHLGFGKKSNGLTKYIVKGLRLHGAGVDGFDIVMMYCPQTKACVVVKAIRHIPGAK